MTNSRRTTPVPGGRQPRRVWGLLWRYSVYPCIFLVLVSSQPCCAQTEGPTLSGGQRLSVSVSGFWANVDSGARADSTIGGIGTRLDFENGLGLEKSDARWVADVTYDFNRRNGLQLSYFNLNRSGERDLTDPVSFRDHEFIPAAALTTSLDTEIWRLSYSYAFVDNPKHRASVQLGFHVASLAIHLSGRRINDSVDANTDAPLPVVGLDYAYRLSSRWTLGMQGQIFRLKLDDVKGQIDNFSALVAYAPLRTTSLFVGYNYYWLDVELAKRFWHGEASLDYRGPWAGIVVGFGGDR